MAENRLNHSERGRCFPFGEVAGMRTMYGGTGFERGGGTFHEEVFVHNCDGVGIVVSMLYIAGRD